jgi:hypothetical protein
MQRTIVATSSFAVLAVVVSLVSALLLAPQAIPRAGAVTSVGVSVYWDSACTNPTTSISWGTVSPGGTTSQTVYVENNDPLPLTLNLECGNWTPTDASSYLTLSWNCTNYLLSSGSVVAAVLTLAVSPSASQITDFSIDMAITGTEVASSGVIISFTTSGLPNGVKATFTVNNVNHAGNVPYTYSESFNNAASVSFSVPSSIPSGFGTAYVFKGWKDENNNMVTSPVTTSASHTYSAQYQTQYVGTITAIVRDTSYRTLPNALISLDGANAGLTDSYGRLAIPSVPTGTHTVTASKEEYNTASATVFLNRGGNAYAYLTLRPKTYSLTVNVHDQNGNTIPNANIYLNGTYKGVTTYSGKSLITGLKRGNYTLRVSKSGYTDYTSPITIPTDTTISATLTKAYTVTVTAKDSATAKAIPSADLYLDGAKVGTTDNFYGRLTIRNVPPGPHILTIKKTGYTDNSTPTNITTDTTITVTLTKT